MNGTSTTSSTSTECPAWVRERIADVTEMNVRKAASSESVHHGWRRIASRTAATVAEIWLMAGE